MYLVDRHLAVPRHHCAAGVGVRRAANGDEAAVGRDGGGMLGCLLVAGRGWGWGWGWGWG
mgnify:CR=1 FL=1